MGALALQEPRPFLAKGLGLGRQVGKESWAWSLPLPALCTPRENALAFRRPQSPCDPWGKKSLLLQTARFVQVTKSDRRNVLQTQDEDADTILATRWPQGPEPRSQPLQRQQDGREGAIFCPQPALARPAGH